MEQFIYNILTWIILILILILALATIMVKNPIYSIFFLILIFFNSASLLLLLGADFIALLILIVYVGAVAVLFVFVIMMLNIKLLEINEPYWKYAEASFILMVAFLFQITATFHLYFQSCTHDILISKLKTNYTYTILFDSNWSSKFFSTNNIQSIGSVLFTYYGASLVLVGFVLLAAMITAVNLTLDSVISSRKQETYVQSSRKISTSIKQKNVLFVNKKKNKFSMFKFIKNELKYLNISADIRAQMGYVIQHMNNRSIFYFIKMYFVYLYKTFKI